MDSVVVLDPIMAPRKGGRLRKELSVLEQSEHSVPGFSPEGGDMCKDEVAGLHLLEHSGADRSANLMGTSGLGPLEHSVPVVPLDEEDQSIDSNTVSDPLKRTGANSVRNPLSALCPKLYSEWVRDGRSRVRYPGRVDGALLVVRKEAHRVPLEEGEAIVAGGIGLTAPWFLTGWAKDMEGWTPSMWASVGLGRFIPVDGELELTVVFPGLSCDMLFVMASIGSDGLLGTEALQSCLPHQLDLRTGQLWMDGRAMLQQKPIPKVEALLMTAVVLPPHSDIVAPVTVSGGLLGPCTLVEPSRSLTEEYGVVVGHTLVDASSWSASVLMINPNGEDIVLPCETCVGKLVPISAVSVALAGPELSGDIYTVLPDHLEDIVTGSHPSLGEGGRRLLRDLLLRYEHVFPAPGEPVTGRTTSVQHEILTSNARPVRCGPRRLAPAGLRTEQTCVYDRLLMTIDRPLLHEGATNECARITICMPPR